MTTPEEIRSQIQKYSHALIDSTHKIAAQEELERLKKQNGDNYFFNKYLSTSYSSNRMRRLDILKQIFDSCLDQTMESRNEKVKKACGINLSGVQDFEEFLLETEPLTETNKSNFEISLRDNSLSKIKATNLSLSYTDSRRSVMLSKSQRMQNTNLDLTQTYQTANKENSYSQKYLSKKKKSGLNFDMPLRKEINVLNESMQTQKINIKNL